MLDPDYGLKQTCSFVASLQGSELRKELRGTVIHKPAEINDSYWQKYIEVSLQRGLENEAELQESYFKR